MSAPTSADRTVARQRRRDVVVVGASLVAVVATWLLMLTDPAQPAAPPPVIGLLVGSALAAALWWRRSVPTALLVAAVVTSPFEAAAVPQLVALFAFARVSRPRYAWMAVALIVVGSMSPWVVRSGWTGPTIVNVVLTTAVAGTVAAAAIASTRQDGRTASDRLADVVVYLVAWLVNLAVLAVGLDVAAIEVVPMLTVELLAVTALTVALWFRREWPVTIAIAGIVVAPFAQFGIGTFLAAAFAVAARDRPWRALAIAAGYVAATVVHVVLVPDTDIRPAAAAVVAGLAYGAAVGWGMVARSRRLLVESLRERARQAEAEQDLRLERARRLERERIAREMHDVLAHRLSLLSVHAGALEYRPDAPPADIAAASAVIRESAHRALSDLREVIGVLRAGPETEHPDRPQPTLASLGGLIDEAARVGVRITTELTADPAEVPEGIGRTAYRVVQEALTNARKHAPAAPVSVRVAGTAGDDLVVEVGNPVVATVSGPAGGGPVATGSAPATTAIPGSGAGLAGLGERVGLAGGTFASGVGPDGRFVVRARLPWPSVSG